MTSFDDLYQSQPIKHHEIASFSRFQDKFVLYGLITALLAVIGYVVWLARAYASERGRLLAISEGFEKTLVQLQLTTEAAEKIRTRISHEDWTQKEVKTLRRQKL